MDKRSSGILKTIKDTHDQSLLSLMFINGLIGRSHTAAADHSDDAPTLSDDKVVLKVLTQGDAAAFFRLYSCENPYDQGSKGPVMPDDTPESFALRIVTACELIWTIRRVGEPTVIIGDFALHHWEKENATIEFGGTLLPTYRGQGIMRAALQLVTQHFIKKHQLNLLVCTTATKNTNAIRFAEKMGFTMTGVKEHTIRWEKTIC